MRSRVTCVATTWLLPLAAQARAAIWTAPHGLEPDPDDPDADLVVKAISLVEDADSLIVKEYVRPLSVHVAP